MSNSTAHDFLPAHPVSILLNGYTFTIALPCPSDQLHRFEKLLEMATHALADARRYQHDPSATNDSVTLDSMALASQELGCLVEELQFYMNSDELLLTFQYWYQACIEEEAHCSGKLGRDVAELFKKAKELSTITSLLERRTWIKRRELLLEMTDLREIVKARRSDLTALRDVAMFADEVVRGIRAAQPPPPYQEASISTGSPILPSRTSSHRPTRSTRYRSAAPSPPPYGVVMTARTIATTAALQTMQLDPIYVDLTAEEEAAGTLDTPSHPITLAA